MVSFPSECYILEDDPNKKAIKVRIFREWDLCDSAVLWIPRKAITSQEMKGYSENNWPVKRIYIKGWFKKIARERIDQYQEEHEREIEECEEKYQTPNKNRYVITDSARTRRKHREYLESKRNQRRKKN